MSDQLDLISAYGDGWYDGFIAAKELAKKEDLDDYNEKDIMRMSEHAESKCQKAKAAANGEGSIQCLNYFTSYSYVSGNSSIGHGNINVGRYHPIRKIEDVMAMTEVIKAILEKEHGIASPSVVILNWKLFE
ncbi:hypothetical protein [Shewanella algae]